MSKIYNPRSLYLGLLTVIFGTLISSLTGVLPQVFFVGYKAPEFFEFSLVLMIYGGCISLVGVLIFGIPVYAFLAQKNLNTFLFISLAGIIPGILSLFLIGGELIPFYAIYFGLLEANLYHILQLRADRKIVC